MSVEEFGLERKLKKLGELFGLDSEKIEKENITEVERYFTDSNDINPINMEMRNEFLT